MIPHEKAVRAGTGTASRNSTADWHYTEPERIREALQFVDSSDRDTWVNIGMAVKSELGEAGYDLWEYWSSKAESFNSKDARSVWKSIRADGKVTIGTLFYEAQKHGWRDDGRKRIAEDRAAKEAAEIERERAETAKKAAAIFKAAISAKADHPYLLRKQVSPVSTLREIDADAAAKILGYHPKSGGDALSGRLLVVPVKRGGGLSTLELIDEEGRKTALAGRGSKAGGYWATERLPDGDGAGLTLQIGEGVATVLSASAATRRYGIAALSSGNLPAVAGEIHEHYPAAVIVLLADLVKATGEPDPHAVEAARAVGGLLAVPDFGGNRPDGATDFNDMAMLCGLEAVKACIETAQPVGEPEAVPENVDSTIASLARMSDVEYEHARTGAAKRMGMRTSVLDKLVQSERKEKASDGIGFDDVEPWPEPVNGAALLSGIADTIRRFIVCNNEMADAAALWVAMTWFIDAIQIAPLAVITAPEKRCGKSQLLAILGKLSFRPMVASNITPAALFRVIDAYRPALMIDEADAFMKENEELRGLLRNI